MLRRALAVLALAALPLLAAPHPTWAQTSGPSTTDKDLTTCVNSNPRPDCGVEPKVSGDRGGSAQYATFAVMVAGLACVGFVVVRSTRRAARVRDRLVEDPTSDRSDPLEN